MDLVCERSILRGSVKIPGSKSHTIRAVALASLAEGENTIGDPLDSGDARSAVRAYRALGAEIEQDSAVWRVKGFGGVPMIPRDVIDVGNSGTSLNISLGSSALLRDGLAVFTGDDQIRRRPEGPLIESLNDLGAKVRSTLNNGCPPIVVEGTARGGKTAIEARNSQYLTSLLINMPLAESDTHVRVTRLDEKPYVEMTLDWLRRLGIRVEHDNMLEFRIPGGQHYHAFERSIPADFSSATFFLAAGALSGNDVVCEGLDMTDTQGDRAVVDYLRQLGASIEVSENSVRISADRLKGCELDLNATPDALPMMAVLACFAEGTTRLVNVPQARIKETDRIAVMKKELERLGARIEELPDGLIIHEAKLSGADVESHGDHRVVMALAVAGCSIGGRTVIHGSEAATVTFPTFVDCLAGIGGRIIPDE